MQWDVRLGEVVTQQHWQCAGVFSPLSIDKREKEGTHEYADETILDTMESAIVFRITASLCSQNERNETREMFVVLHDIAGHECASTKLTLHMGGRE